MAEQAAGLDLEALRREQAGVHAAFDRYGGSRTDYCVWTSMEQFDAILAALERGERVKKAASEVKYEIERMLALGQVPQLKQIGWWGSRLDTALEGDDG